MSILDKITHLKTQLSRLNHRRKLHYRNNKKQRHFDNKIARSSEAEISQIRHALSLLQPKKVDLPLVRVGSDNDGGYLVPDDFDGISALFSPGVSNEIGFDREVAAMGVDCFLADASVDSPDNLPENIHFRQKFIGTNDSDQFITMQTWVADSVQDRSDLMLQMDIEGAEYAVLNHVQNDLLKRFRIILLELHDMHRLTEDAWRENLISVLTNLNQNHVLCHLHPNNTAGSFKFDDKIVPEVLELSFILNDRVVLTGETADIPHPLDQLNSNKLPDIPRPLFWEER